MEGTTARVTGTVKKITDPWTAYDRQDNTGHFFPLLLPEECSGQKITVKGRSAGDREVVVEEDRLLILRLENLDGNEAVLWKEGSLYRTVDFSGAVRG